MVHSEEEGLFAATPFRSQIGAMLSALREMIVSGRALPGEKLLIVQLCGEHGASPGAVREALSRLVAEGLVVAEEQRGFRVAPISDRELMDITGTRILIETQALRLSMARGTASWEAEVLAAFHRLSKAPYFPDDASNGQALGWAAEHKAFHRSLVAACGSDWLLRFHDTLFTQSERYRLLNRLAQSRQARAERRDVHDEHRKLMKAVLDRRLDHASDLIEAHFKGTANRVLKAYVDAEKHPLSVALSTSNRSSNSARFAHRLRRNSPT